MINKTVLGILFAGLVSTAAIADEKAGNIQDVEATKLLAFEKLDVEKNGSITLAEAKGTWLADVFEQLDADQNGAISWEEYKQK